MAVAIIGKMSWWGVHPVMSKSEARRYLPPEVCKHCVYSFRLTIPGLRQLAERGAERSDFFSTRAQCTRCGFPQGEFEEKLLTEFREACGVPIAPRSKSDWDETKVKVSIRRRPQHAIPFHPVVWGYTTLLALFVIIMALLALL
jgi:hypothetical protein